MADSSLAKSTPITLKRRKMRRLKRIGEHLGARKDSEKSMRSDLRTVLFSGGTPVKCNGYLEVKRDGLTSGWKNKIVYFEHGLLRTFDPDLVFNREKKTLSPLRKLRMSRASNASKVSRSGKKKSDMSNYSSTETNGATAAQKLVPDDIIDIVQIKSITYDKRNSKFFTLVVRPVTDESPRIERRSKNALPEDKESEKRSSVVQRLSSAFRSNASTGSRKHFSLMPGNWNSKATSCKTFRFRAPKGSEADRWVQAILFELRNQAVCLSGSLKMMESRRENEVVKIDCLHRQSVDLWALAKGKISHETLSAVEKFVAFLEKQYQETLLFENQSRPSKASDMGSKSSAEEIDFFTAAADMVEVEFKDVYEPELRYWQETAQLLKEILQSAERSVENPGDLNSGLDELQVLNDPFYHKTKDHFTYVEMILKKENDKNFRAPGKFLGLTMRKLRRSKPSKNRITIDDIGEIQDLRNDLQELNTEHKELSVETTPKPIIPVPDSPMARSLKSNASKKDQFELGFKSAQDLKIELDQKQDEMMLSRIRDIANKSEKAQSQAEKQNPATLKAKEEI